MSYSSHEPYTSFRPWASSAGLSNAGSSSATAAAAAAADGQPAHAGPSSPSGGSQRPQSATTRTAETSPSSSSLRRKRSHTSLCAGEADGDEPADGDRPWSGGYYGEAFDRARAASDGSPPSGEDGSAVTDVDADDGEDDEGEQEEHAALRRIEDRIKRRRPSSAAVAIDDDEEGGEASAASRRRSAVRASFSSAFSARGGSLEEGGRMAVDGAEDGDADGAATPLYGVHSSLRPLGRSSPVGDGVAASSGVSRAWRFLATETSRVDQRRFISPPSTSTPAVSAAAAAAAPPLSTRVNATSSSFSPSPSYAGASSTALPLSMRRRPPLVRNATAVPAPLSPEVSTHTLVGSGGDSGPSYFPSHAAYPTPPPSVSHSRRATAVNAQLAASSPSGTTLVSRPPVLAPRRPGALDASGRLRGPSRSANESWLGIRAYSPPPVLSAVEAAGATPQPAAPQLLAVDGSSDTAFGSTRRAREAGSDESSARTSARSWAPIGGGLHSRTPFSPPSSASSSSARPWTTSISSHIPLSPPPTVGLRPFRLRPSAVISSQPELTSSSSASARRTSLLAHLGSANEDAALESDLGSIGVSRSRLFDSFGIRAGDGAGARRRRSGAPPAGDEVQEGTSAGGGTSAASGFRPLVLPERVRAREQTPPAAPTLSFLRPLQLPLSSATSTSSTPSGSGSVLRRSHPAPPVLTSAFGFDDEEEEDDDDQEDALTAGLPTPQSVAQPRADRLNFLTRLPVMLPNSGASGSTSRGEGSGGTAAPSFSLSPILASDWAGSGSSTPAESAPPVRRTPTLRPRTTTDRGFSERFAALPSARTPSDGALPPPPTSSFSPFSDFHAVGAVHPPSLSPDTASTSTAGAGSEPPAGAGSRLAEYLSRHSERRRRLMPGLVQAEEEAVERQADDWTGSLLDWFSSRPNSTADPAEIQQTEEHLAARRRRLSELRRTRSSTTPSATTLPTTHEPSSNLTRTLEALGTRGRPDDGAPTSAGTALTGASIWDALLLPPPVNGTSERTTADEEQPRPAPPRSRFTDSGLPSSPRSREAMLHALLRQITADLSSLSPPPHRHMPLGDAFPSSFLGGPVRPREGGEPALFTSSLFSETAGLLRPDFVTEEEIDLSYEGLIELSARVPAVVRATPEWVIQRLPVESFRDQRAKKASSEVDERCAVCLDDYQPHDLTMTSPCGHFLHKTCLERWLRASHVCPLCRTDVMVAADDGAAGALPPPGATTSVDGGAAAVPMDVGGL